MLEPAVIVLRLIQYAGTMVLMGSALFFLYALPKTGAASATALKWPRPLLAAGATAVLVGSLLGVIAQTIVMAGSLQEGLKPSSLSFVMTSTGLGRASLVRVVAAGMALSALLILRPSRGLWRLAALLGVVICASLAWMGHGAASEGPGALLHLMSDIIHALAAAVWIGALAAFLILLCSRSPGTLGSHRALHHALHGFSGVGAALVALLVATGLINSWFLVGPTRLGDLLTTPYGQLLLAKLALFGVMLGLAAANRWRLTPALQHALDADRPPNAELAELRRSLMLETASALAVLCLVAWLGTLAPVSAQ